MLARRLERRTNMVLGATARAIETQAKQRVPVDSGALRDSIRAEQQSPGHWQVGAGDNEAWYAGLVEYGTRRTPARPYLTPAAVLAWAAVNRELRRVL